MKLSMRNIVIVIGILFLLLSGVMGGAVVMFELAAGAISSTVSCAINSKINSKVVILVEILICICIMSQVSTSGLFSKVIYWLLLGYLFGSVIRLI